MKYTSMIVVNANEIENAVKLQYDEDIELASLMWPEDYQNDCYKPLSFDDDMVEEWEEDEYYSEEVRRQHLLVYSVLRDTFPAEVRNILVDVSW